MVRQFFWKCKLLCNPWSQNNGRLLFQRSSTFYYRPNHSIVSDKGLLRIIIFLFETQFHEILLPNIYIIGNNFTIFCNYYFFREIDFTKKNFKNIFIYFFWYVRVINFIFLIFNIFRYEEDPTWLLWRLQSYMEWSG